MNNKLLEQLYKEYANELYLYLYSLCRNKQISEDLIQEVFLKAMFSLHDNHNNFRAWLYLVAKNLCFNKMKKEKRIVHYDEFSKFATEDALLDKIIANDKKRLLYQGIMSLPERLRQVIVLQYFSELSQKEIASVMEINQGNVRVLVYRAKKELKNFLEGMGYEF